MTKRQTPKKGKSDEMTGKTGDFKDPGMKSEGTKGEGEIEEKENHALIVSLGKALTDTRAELMDTKAVLGEKESELSAAKDEIEQLKNNLEAAETELVKAAESKTIVTGDDIVAALPEEKERAEEKKRKAAEAEKEAEKKKADAAVSKPGIITGQDAIKQLRKRGVKI